MELPYKLLTETATTPTKGSEDAAGFDLYFDAAGIEVPQGEYGTVTTTEAEVWLLPGDFKAFDTGVAVAIPEGHYGRVAPRSGLAFKYAIDVLAGVIDADYRGQVSAILINLGHDAVKITHGDRIAQLIIEKYTPTELIELTELPETVRGAGKFGSTGT